MNQLALFFTQLWVLFRPLIIQLLTEGGLLLVKYAVEAVTKVEETMPEAPGPEKKQEAVDIVTEKLAEKGIKIPDAIINATVDTAVVKLKSDAVIVDMPDET